MDLLPYMQHPPFFLYFLIITSKSIMNLLNKMNNSFKVNKTDLYLVLKGISCCEKHGGEDE